ncbi:hypothetical protein OS493_027247 [Desmophyllum pertusum]|uniref:Uncharacterized protein n=1 Tax=Desmophyllum pertusum TaxID=174260 RepID=A0A9X0CW28_9CNID|nr:hypothetical protein OS493_027247 [Desmophyllum pertusum]
MSVQGEKCSMWRAVSVWTPNKRCKNRASQDNTDNERRPRARNEGFRLSSAETSTEEQQRSKENDDVKEFLNTLDDAMVRKTGN